jgi:hypothetical protein
MQVSQFKNVQNGEQESVKERIVQKRRSKSVKISKDTSFIHKSDVLDTTMNKQV